MKVLDQRRLAKRLSGISVTLLMATIALPLQAQVFEKVGSPLPISPTGIAVFAPASSRAAGWTIVAPESRLGLMTSNPAFLGGEGWQLSLDGAMQANDFDDTDFAVYEQTEVRLGSIAGKVRLGKVDLGVAYQNPDFLEYEPVIFRSGYTSVQRLETWTGASCIEVTPNLRCGAAFSGLEVQYGASQLHSFQATFGAEFEVQRGSAVSLAFKSEPFGQDAEQLLAPAMVQLDARQSLGPLWTLAVRFAAGWWNDTRSGVRESPLDFGVGAGWLALPQLQILAGAHHVRERLDCASDSPGCESGLIRRDQGTFLDAGLVLKLPNLGLSIAVEDNHIDASQPATSVTLSIQTAFAAR